MLRVSRVIWFALLLAIPAVCQAGSPHWKSGRTSGWNFGLDGMAQSQKQQVYAWAAQHYDFITDADARLLDYYRSLDPTVGGLGRYAFFVSAIEGSERQQAIEDQAIALGRDVDDAYLHYSYDKLSPIRASYDVSKTYAWLRTEFDAAAGNYKVYVPGWDPANDKNSDGYVDDAEFANLANASATARRRQHARYSGWSWGPPPSGPQWQLNINAFDIVKVIIEMYGPVLDEPANWGQTTGYGLLTFDAVDGFLWGGDILEYPRSPGGDASADWQADLAQMLSYAKELYGGRVLIGGNVCQGHWPVDSVLDVCVREGMFSTWSTARDWQGALPGGLYGPFNPLSAYWLAREAGKIQLLQHQYNLLYYIADTPAVWARDRIFGVAAYYLLQNPGYDYWAAYRGYGYWPTVDTNEKMWSHALEVDIGVPTDTVPAGTSTITPWGVWVLAEGADPGHPDYPDVAKCRYKVFARAYSNGLVLLKPKSGYDAARSTFANNTATTHDLSGWYQPVYDDGTLGAPTTSVTLRNGEAAILVGGQPTVTLTATPSAAMPGAEVTYAATCTNPFPDPLTSVKIQGRIPAGTTYVPDSALVDGTPVTPQFAPNPEDPAEIWIWTVVDHIEGDGGSRQFEYKVRLAGP
ncbi:MAG TPA: DUF11 domain-containing protein [Anaerolineae bacterium]|nr:DUF11 domain-containing protein [Anaerolineae bacterium]